MYFTVLYCTLLLVATNSNSCLVNCTGDKSLIIVSTIQFSYYSENPKTLSEYIV